MINLDGITPAEINVLRIEAALESAYPKSAEKLGDKRASVILAELDRRRGRAAHDAARSVGA